MDFLPAGWPRSREVVRLARLERATCGLEVRCSIQLSYRRVIFFPVIRVQTGEIGDTPPHSQTGTNIPEIALLVPQHLRKGIAVPATNKPTPCNTFETGISIFEP